MCDRWLESFDNFFKDMGPKPSTHHSLDREDNDKGYHPNNCRWATDDEQRANKSRHGRKEGVYCLNGKEYTLSELNELTGLDREALRYRIDAGMTFEEICSPTQYLKGSDRRKVLRKRRPKAQS